MPKITLEQLMAKMADRGLDEAELADYFILDEEASGPFAPQLRLNPTTVQIPRTADAAQRTAALMNSANWFARMNRQIKFQRKLADGYDGPIIVSEGDSWFQYPIRLKDTIDHLMDRYAVKSLGAAGDLLKRMADKQEYVGALRETGADILLMSGGGNDLVAGGALASHLEPFDPALQPQDYLLPSFTALLDASLEHYARMFRQVRDEFPHVTVMCHGYDYPVPNKDRWLGKPMESRGIRDTSLQKDIAKCMMDDFNRRLRRLAGAMPNVIYLDCRGVIGDHRWFDGLHPTDEGYADVAQKFHVEISRIANRRSGPRSVISGPFGSAGALTRSMGLAAPAIALPTARGMSLHLGLNTVDPGHYAGWDGRLIACEADAHAMESLAGAEGYEPKKLLTQDATREAVVGEIKRAASELAAGDMFLFTVSAHGGQLVDFNQDEMDPGDVTDETLCLYDFQLADDEIYMLWSEFKPGVRILMIPDTCHSGSMTRTGAAFLSAQGTFAVPSPPAGVRMMPKHIGDQVARNNEAAYRAINQSTNAIKESVIMAPLSSPIRASVLNLGAALDNQFAFDGAQNGAFTGALLSIWNGGAFAGDYRQFRDQIDDTINNPQQTPRLFDALIKEPDFTSHRPFSINPGMQSKPSTFVPAPAGPDQDDGEGAESDLMPDETFQAILSAKTRGFAHRSTAHALAWSDYADFDAFMTSLGLKNFSTDEFLILGGAHNTPGGACEGKNTYPPRALWPNIAATARVLDQLRDRLGKPIVITNAYRSPEYNTCIDGAEGSQHKEFTALDFKVSGMSQPDVAMALRWMRDKENGFKGGIGRYNSFTHVDTRGHNATWPKSFRDAALPGTAPLSPAGPRDMSERLAMLDAIVLATPRDMRRRGRAMDNAMTKAVSRSGEGFDPTSGISEGQQSLQAAVNASSVISFVENLTPGQKEDVLLSTLFAQRAADAKADPITDRDGWYAIYSQVLGILGWSREASPFESSHKMQGNGSFDQVILATLAQIATGNQFKIVDSAIKALRGLADTDGKIKLFDFQTSRTSGGNFQIGSAEAAGDVISMALGAFNFTFKDERKNILFVSWGKNELDYWIQAQKLALSPEIYADVRDKVKERLNEARKTLIADIDLGDF